MGVGSLRVIVAYVPYRYYLNDYSVPVRHWTNRIQPGTDVND
jgi:hypothetical protein